MELDEARIAADREINAVREITKSEFSKCITAINTRCKQISDIAPPEGLYAATSMPLVLYMAITSALIAAEDVMDEEDRATLLEHFQDAWDSAIQDVKA